jgi:23S rRNA-/tRNA-specific pseudouridylate synthase
VADGPLDPRLEPQLLWSDPWLLALAKPSGLLSQPGLGPELADSLISRAQRCWPEARLVHRLDRDTSGLILLARDAESHRRLSAAFAQRRVRKTYLARVHGVPAAAPCCCSPTPAAPTSCGCIWPGWAIPYWGIRSTRTPAWHPVHR